MVTSRDQTLLSLIIQVVLFKQSIRIPYSNLVAYSHISYNGDTTHTV